MAQQQHHRGPEARKIELERRLDKNENTLRRGLCSTEDESSKEEGASSHQGSAKQGGQAHRDE